MTNIPSPDEVEAFIDSIDPAQLRDATSSRLIEEAARQVEIASATLLSRVTDARAAGDSWVLIGASLRVTRQAAEQRFGKAVRAQLATRERRSA